jgi:hypothetical protein
MSQLKEKRIESSRTKSQEQRIEQLERELSQAGLTIEALVQLLENAKVITREELGNTIHEIDASDGVIDGKITPPEQQLFQPKRTWPDGTPEG